MELSGWGRYPRHVTECVAPLNPEDARSCTERHDGVVARGLGRAYGDAAIGERMTLATSRLNRMCAFDPATGLLSVEAGLSLADIIACFLPRGFFPPVVPGTRFVTVGGMIASDVHGKNQHRQGSFGEHVEMLTLALPNGEEISCSRNVNPDLFRATVGGMGLTGTILDASFRLLPVETGWVRQDTYVAGNLAQAIELLRRTDEATYSVAWIDVLARGAALGRSLILAGWHATLEDLGSRSTTFPPSRTQRLGVPFECPGWVLNRLSVSAFNELYYRRGARKAGETTVVPWDSYFFPLDNVANWNRIYGRRGFLQHQCVIPADAAESVLGECLERLAASGQGSFLAVLKRLRGSPGLMSFGMDGFTLALDLPVNENVLALLDEIDTLVADAGGRLYLAKDARQSPATLEAGYPGLGTFRRIRTDVGAKGHIASKLSERLGL